MLDKILNELIRLEQLIGNNCSVSVRSCGSGLLFVFEWLNENRKYRWQYAFTEPELSITEEPRWIFDTLATLAVSRYNTFLRDKNGESHAHPEI